MAWLAALAPWSPAIAAEPTEQGRLHFRNGDRLTGQLTGLDQSSQSLQWHPTQSAEGFPFDLATVSHAFLHDRGPSLEGSPQPLFNITLTDGTELVGAIRELNETSLLLEAGFESPLTIERPHLQRIDATLSASQLLYQGPKGPDEWEVGYRGKNWRFEEERLVSDSYSSTGKTLEIPDRARIEIDVSLREDPTLNLFLCADNPRNGGDSYYYLQLTPNVINCQRYWRDHPRTYINLTKEYEDEAAKKLFLGQPQVHLGIEIDRKAKLLHLFVNGELYARFFDPSPKAPEGSSMILASYGNGAVRASAIRVYALPRLTASEKRGEVGSIVWRDGKRTEAELGIDPEGVATSGSHTSSVDQLLSAVFAKPAAFKPKDGELNFFLTRGSRLSGPATLRHDQFVLDHSLLGVVHIPMSSVDGFVSNHPTSDLGPGPQQNSVTFKNGDRLGGKFLAWDDDGGLQWILGAPSDPLVFDSRSVAQIQLSPPAPLSASAATAHLVSGDGLPGQVTRLANDRMELHTAFSTPLQIPFPVIRRIDFRDPSSVLFQGPGPLIEWQVTGASSRWQQTGDGTLSGKGAGRIGRTLPMPRRGRLDVELSWKGQLDASITLFAKALERSVQPQSYRLHCEIERFSLYRGLGKDEVLRDPPDDNPLRNRRLDEQLERFSAQFGGGATRRLGSPVAVKFHVHKLSRLISLCWDADKGTIALLMDGQVLRAWEDPSGLAPPSNGLVIEQHSRNSTLELLDLSVREWNGVLPDPPMSASAAQSLRQTVVRLRNQDEFIVDALSLTNSQAPLAFDSELGELSLPLDRVESVQFPRVDHPLEHRLGMVADGYLAPQGKCRFFLERASDGQLDVSSPYFGKSTFNLEAFKKLEFDLQDRRYWDRGHQAWPPIVPLSMRATIRQATENASAQQAMSEAEAQAKATQFNESVELDE